MIELNHLRDNQKGQSANQKVGQLDCGVAHEISPFHHEKMTKSRNRLDVRKWSANDNGTAGRRRINNETIQIKEKKSPKFAPAADIRFLCGTPGNHFETIFPFDSPSTWKKMSFIRTFKSKFALIFNLNKIKYF